MAFVLAAIAAGDAGASRGAISTELSARVLRVLSEARDAMQLDRAVAIAGLARALALTVPEETTLPPRARAIIATLVPKELGAGWMRASPAPRPGFRTSGALRRTLAGLAEASWRV